MHVRIVEISIGIIIGIVTWWCWEPSVANLRIGLFAYSILLIFCRQIWQIRMIFWIMALLLGALRMSSMTNTTNNDSDHDGYTTGWVVKANRRQALIQNEEQRLNIDFYPEAPNQGSLVSVWHQPKRGLIHWDGGVNPKKRILRERTGRRQAKEWIVHMEPKRAVKPEILDHLKYGDVLWALLSGDKSGISSDLKSLFRQTGTSHLLAISGMHIGLVSALAYVVLYRLIGWVVLIDRSERWGIGDWVKRLALFGSIITAIAYGHQVGWSASAQRAVFMVCIYCLGKGIDLYFSLWDVLGLAAAIMLMLEPSLMHDLGFQLSFTAVIGIGLFGQYAYRLTSKSQSRLIKGIIVSIGMTLGATLGTVPICAWIFQAIPLTGVIANLLVTPLLATMAVPVSMVGLLAGMIGCSVVEMALFLIADACVEVSIRCLKPLMFSPLSVAFDVLDVWLAFVCILSGAAVGSKWGKSTAGIVFMALVWQNSPYGGTYDSFVRRRPEMKIQFLPVGQGDATLIEWQDGEVWLVDGGPFTFDLVPYLKRQGVWRIDRVWLSHPHADHMDGLFPVLTQLEVGSLVVGRMLESADEGGQYFALWDLARSQNVPIQIAHTLQRELNRENRGVRILHPNDWTVDTSDRCNEESIVLELQIDKYKILLTGDIEEDAERELLDDLVEIDVLKVAHHGSRSSSSIAAISLLKPKWSVISVGDGNRFGHPHAQTLWTLKDSTVLRTDWHGLIQIEVDKGRIEVFE